MKRIVLCGGGTAGHIIPNIALVPYLSKYFDKIYYMGNIDGLEYKIATENNLEFYSTDVIKLQRDKLLSNIKIPFVLYKGIKQAKNILRKISPSIIFCKGGYASLPSALAGRCLNIPVICHESDMTLGLANKIISNFADATLTSFKDTIAKGNVIYTGLPIRDIIDKGNKNKLIRQLNLHMRANILVMGGSQGSQPINKALIDALPYLVKDYNIIHISGKAQSSIESDFYKNIEFVSNIQDYYDLADIVISRAGATACAEITYLRKKAILIPLPKGNSRGDQEQNANYYEKLGLVKVLQQSNLSKESLISAIKDLENSPSPQYSISKASNVEIANLISQYCR